MDLLAERAAEGVVNLNKFTYAGNLATLKYLSADARHAVIFGCHILSLN
jgi:dTDP-D-glucose 4,6-dehydratase